MYTLLCVMLYVFLVTLTVIFLYSSMRGLKNKHLNLNLNLNYIALDVVSVVALVCRQSRDCRVPRGVPNRAVLRFKCIVPSADLSLRLVVKLTG